MTIGLDEVKEYLYKNSRAAKIVVIL